MVPQLSTSDRVSQPHIALKRILCISSIGPLLAITSLILWSPVSFSQGTDFELKIEPLTSIDSVLTFKKPNGEHSTDESGARKPRESRPNEELATRCWCRT